MWKNSNNSEEKLNDYEILLRKLESEIRNHIKVKVNNFKFKLFFYLFLKLIKVEHQLKIFSDDLQYKIERIENENEVNKLKYQKLKEVKIY